jgi:hypothetical protein
MLWMYAAVSGVLKHAISKKQGNFRFFSESPYRLVVRTSRRGRDHPGSTPGGDIFHALDVVAVV